MNNSTLNDIDITQLEMTPSGLFAFQNYPVTIYLKDSGKRASTLKKNIHQNAKFHIAPCSTIGDPRSSKRVQRYVATARTDGWFPVFGSTPSGELEEVEVKLQVCRACLAKLNYNRYNDCSVEIQDQLANDFDLVELFNRYPVTPIEDDSTVSQEMTIVVEAAPPTETVCDTITESHVEPISVTPTPAHSAAAAAPQNLTSSEYFEKKGKPVPKAQFTLLTNIYILQALLERLKILLFK